MPRTKSKESMLSQRLGQAVANQRKTVTAESKEPEQAVESELNAAHDDEIAKNEQPEEMQTDGANSLERERRRTTVQTGPARYKGLQPGQERATIIVDSDQISKVREIAYARNMSIRELMKEIIGMYLEKADTK